MDGMIYSEKKFAYSQRQGKPFVDQNLQFQYLEGGTSTQADSPLNPVYSHYLGSNPSIHYLIPPINEAELCQAMNHAQQTFLAWKKQRDYLNTQFKHNL